MMEKETVRKLARLARIKVSDDEISGLMKDLDSVLGYVGELQGVVSDGGTEPRVGAVRNVLREDAEAHESGLYTDEILREAPDSADGYIKVKKIL